MLPFLQSFSLSPIQWIFICICGLFIGMTKVGLPVAIIKVPIMALIFGGKDSTGIVLPMLLMADFIGVAYYRRSTQWKYLIRLLPSIILGVLLGVLLGNSVDDKQFKLIMAVLIFACLALMILKNKKDPQPNGFQDHWLFSNAMGMLVGFSSMMGNLAGPFIAIYLLSQHLPKNVYIGTNAWIFLITNSIKFPMHIFVWKTVTMHTFSLDLMMIPMIIIGAFLGIKLVKRIPEKWYRFIIIVITAISSLLLII